MTLEPTPEAQQEKRRPALTLSEAAEVSGRHRQTIRAYLDDGRFPGAWREDSRQGAAAGPWRIPVDDLHAVGLDAHEEGQRRRQRPGAGDVLETLRRERDEALHRAEVAEALLRERERTVEALQLALRTLTQDDGE